MATLIAEGERQHVVIMGAGPAGLTAAYELMKHDVPITVVEKDPRQVGGLARTAEYKGYRFDIGGHRFFSKNEEVEDLWTEILGDEMLTRGRLRGSTTAASTSPTRSKPSTRCGTSVRSRRSAASPATPGPASQPVKDPTSLEDWVRNQFGWRLYSIFFKTYTEKVWGISTKELSADWAAQRIKSLDLWVVIRSALLPRREAAHRGDVVTTLIDRFRYPRLGPGQMWERVADMSRDTGHPVLLGRSVARINHEGGGCARSSPGPASGQTEEHTGTDFISSIPVRELVSRLDPPPPEAVLRAAESLSYRDFITVALMVDRPSLFPDNWIYIHDPSVKVGRMQNFKNWSPAMVPDQGKTCLGLEYFCFEGDGLWTMDDAALVELARGELARLGICRTDEVFDGVVVRQQKAYPVYDDDYQARVERHPRLSAVEPAEPSPGRAQRHAQVQQPGPLDDDGAARGPEHRHRLDSRPLEGQRGRRVPRGHPGRRARPHRPAGP